VSDYWKQRERPPMLEAKFIFDGYDSLRAFLDTVAEKSENADVIMNVSFGRDYASLVIYAGGESLSEGEQALAMDISGVYEQISGGKIINN